MELLPYQVTSVLLNAKRMTGIPYEVDGSLEHREFVCVGLSDEEPGDEITKILVSPHSPWETALFTVTLLHILGNPWLNALDHVPIVGWFTRFFVSRRVASQLL